MTGPITYVVATTYRDFLMWCQENETNPRSPELRYMSRVDHLRGTRNPRVILLPGWLDRPDWREIRDVLLIREAEVIEP